MDQLRYYIEWNDGHPTICRMPKDVYGIDDDQGMTLDDACNRLWAYHTDNYLLYQSAMAHCQEFDTEPDFIRIKQG
jgi:hypothetical protein